MPARTTCVCSNSGLFRSAGSSERDMVERRSNAEYVRFRSSGGVSEIVIRDRSQSPRGGSQVKENPGTSSRLSRRQLLKQSAVGATAVAALGIQNASAAPASTSALRLTPRHQDRVEILHWSHPLTDDDTTVFNPMIQKFQEAGNNVDVKIELVPWDGRIERKMSAAAAGTSPDTSYLNVDEFTTYAVEGALVELEGFIPQESVDDFLPGPKDAMTWDEHIYEIPVLHAFRLSYINTDIWTQSGLDPEATPKTWEEIDTALAA